MSSHLIAVVHSEEKREREKQRLSERAFKLLYAMLSGPEAEAVRGQEILAIKRAVDLVEMLDEEIAERLAAQYPEAPTPPTRPSGSDDDEPVPPTRPSQRAGKVAA